MDMGKYRAIFIDEATEHIAGIGSSLLELEKRPGDGEQVDDIFRRAHSIKGMAASLGYDSITEISHGMEDRMQAIRAAGCVGGDEELGLLFRALEALESMLTAVRTDGEAPPHRPELAAALADEVSPEAGETKKKALSLPPL